MSLQADVLAKVEKLADNLHALNLKCLNLCRHRKRAESKGEEQEQPLQTGRQRSNRSSSFDRAIDRLPLRSGVASKSAREVSGERSIEPGGIERQRPEGEAYA